MQTTPLVSASQAEELAPGLTFERIHDGQIHVFHFTEISRQAIDAWIDKTRELLGSWTNERPYMVLTVVTGKYLTLTPYWRSRVEEISRWRPDTWTYAAIVLPNSFFMQLSLMFIPTLRLRNTHSRLFNSREQALAWLEKELEQNKGKSLAIPA